MPHSFKNSICEERLYELLFKRQAKALRNYLCAKFGDMQLAEDLLQEAFVKLWENCDNVSPDKAKSYVFAVATNLGINQKRHEQVKFKNQSLIARKYKSTTNESPEFLMLENEFLEKFTKAIAELPDRQREVFLLSRVEKKTYKEIAELSNVSVKAIEKLMHKALLKLKKSLDDIKL
ncbi:RNA polymerase sigma factor [Aquimarina pacifica]|uniref:RNA polymerase sigma factor n=1 Tax=Aquimarina pacifica TaxID=1296415 RepID=UPI00046EC73F|nr:sigma-70 family RNA polymerase sigma factor [Aquimarina pacifica]